MTTTDRDRKIILLLVPVMILAAYWFLLLAPKREEAATAGQELAAQEQRRDDAQARTANLTGARSSFAADYGELVRIGKAVPTTIDMPTVLVQLEDAAKGTGIKFRRIAASEREVAVAPAPPAGAPPAAAGGEPAQSGPGTAVESAGNAAAAADTQTSQTARDGALPVGGGTAVPATAGVTGTAVPGLDTVALELELAGTFIDLSDFFHRIKRYVELDEKGLDVRGRLLTIDGVEFSSEPETFPRIVATLTATIYLSPRVEGVTAGATPGGPAATPVSTGADASAPLATSTPAAAR